MAESAVVSDDDGKPGLSPAPEEEHARSTAGNEDNVPSKERTSFATRPRMVRDDRKDHLASLMQHHRASMRYIDKDVLGLKPDESEVERAAVADAVLEDTEKEDIAKQSVFLKKVASIQQQLAPHVSHDANAVEVRLSNVSYRVPIDPEEEDKIKTVYNQSPLYTLVKCTKRLFTQARRKAQAVRDSASSGDGTKSSEELSSTPTSRCVLQDINLALEPGKMYLILGPPGSGKSSLLKAIAALLPHKEKAEDGPRLEGEISYNGLSRNNEEGILVNNITSYVDQEDRHAPRLTVDETLNFAFQCKAGGSHLTAAMDDSPELESIIKKADAANLRMNMVLEGLGLSHVSETFVGNSDVRGVSGGQRRRVTLAEMMMWSVPILCADEISTGLDAASTYDIVRILNKISRVNKVTRVMSLLQPSPETFSIFDEVLLLAEGRIIYAGPIGDVVGYFTELGYPLPDQIDVADYLQMISTPDGRELFHPTTDNQMHLTPELFAAAFLKSKYGQRIRERLESSLMYNWTEDGQGAARTTSKQDEEKGAKGGISTLGSNISTLGSNIDTLSNTIILRGGKKVRGKDAYKIRYQNNFMRSTWLNFQRNFTIWSRDKRYIFAMTVKNIAMGISAGAVFFQTNDSASIFGVLFQGMLFIMLGAMTSAPEQITDRAICYKHLDANFYPTGAYVIGRAASLVPQAVMDIVIFGGLIYWMVGFTATAGNFFIYLATLLVFNLAFSQMLSVITSVAPSRSVVQAGSAFILLLLMLFCGFIVAPDVIPDYYIWLYWWNPLAWAYRALLVNEFTSDEYNGEGELVLESYGFTDSSGKPFGQEWVGFCFAYLVPHTVLCAVATWLCLTYIRVEAKQAAPDGPPASTIEDEKIEVDNESLVDVPFIPVDLTFENICYEVKSSTKDTTLKLLNNVNGQISSGRMCALVGSSGAGKTTLMDVIALRKTSGTITGEVRLNGHLQEPISFRRCSGYVEQFDVQSAELTVRETVLFSARLRLDTNNSELSALGDIEKYVDSIIRLLELTREANLLVGSEEEGGLSFEQKKRLSIAVELAASPSILFLDEPTSGLDSRAALLVMKSLRKVASTGRTVCATIHQPSSAVFEMFDDLLLMKKGGEAVYFGELGDGSRHLIEYFEGYGATPIHTGENPSTWMLNVIGGGTTQSGVDGEKPFDWAETYRQSESHRMLTEELGRSKKEPDDTKKIHFDSEFAATKAERNKLMQNRIVTIYWRSPAYNLGRMSLSIFIAFLLSSVFIQIRSNDEFTETEISSIFSTIFISFIIVGVLAITSVLPVMLSIRDMFYRHKAAGMLDHSSVNLALAVAEKRFILISGALFCIVFWPTIGLSYDFTVRRGVSRLFGFWGFFTFNIAIYSYCGQLFVCLVRGMSTAQILASVFIGINNFFSGLIVRPQFMTGFWAITYWICPGHYVYEGLITTQFQDDDRKVIANIGSEFWDELGCKEEAIPCKGTVSEFMSTFFGGEFDEGHIRYDALVLGGILLASRVLTYYALKRFNYSST